MNLPSVAQLNEFNRILLAVVQLSSSNAGCKVRSVINLCSSFTFGGRAVDHYETLRLCRYAGLLSMEKGWVKLTVLGLDFLRCNSANSYEITDKQKKFIAEQLVICGPWQSQARDLVLNLSPNYDKLTYETNLYENPLPVRYNSIIHLLLALGVLSRMDSILLVAPNFVAPVKYLRASSSGVSQQELAQSLQANMKLANQAEEAILEYERERLSSIDRKVEAKLVRRVSQLDTKAGYDIESFDGDKVFLIMIAL